MDDLLKFKFETLSNISEFSIDNFPLFLNTEGCFIIVKDKSDKLKKPTEDDINYCYRPGQTHNKKTLGTSNSNSTIESSGSTSKFKKTDKYSFNKDKGLVITVKNKFNKDSGLGNITDIVDEE